MADLNTTRRTITQQLFGQDIAFEKMTPEQRQKFLAEVQRQAVNGTIPLEDARDLFSGVSAAPGPKPVDAGSSARAQAVGTLSNRTAQQLGVDSRLLGNLEGETSIANQIDRNAIGSLTSSQDKARDQYYGIAGNVRRDATAANDLSAQLFGGYAQGQGALNAQDQAGYDRYMGETNPLMTQLQARGSDPADMQRQLGAYNMASGIAGGSLDYTADQYASNPADVARQQQMYNTLLGVGNGSLDYSAAQWQSNAADVARQLQGYNDLRGIGQGSLDWQSQAAKAYANPEDLANQRLALTDIRRDLTSGSAGQKDVRDKFKALSDPQVTAKERFLSELARREFEAGDRGSRAASSEALANRGLRSGGQQIAMTQAARQQLSQDRLLKELGIQAQAVDRSMTALGGWSNSENSIRSGDQNALNMQAGLSTALRNASFDEAYKRGLGADSASAANQGTRLTGYAQSANQATNIRNASDAVGTFNTGQTNIARANNQSTRLSGYQGAASQSNAIRTANDAVGTFNVGQTNVAKANNQSTRVQGAQLTALQSNAIRSANDSQRQYEDTYTQNEATRVGNLAGQRASEGRATTAQIGGRQTDVNNAGQGVIQDAYARTSDANKADWDAAGKDYGMAGDYFDAVTGTTDRRVGRASGLASTTSNISAQGTQNLADALGLTANQWSTLEEKSLANRGY